ncbi:hypothetical protein AB0M22_26430 [Nocardia sp. NPDC051756]|uniref:hypothetical protein n=1 Tax=Nocardia sp. NPDC051756 TaxID=3154751 RepID=UPI0034138AEE
MTVAVWVKVFDGIVLSTDSATTLAHPLGEQVYNNADKIFNLHRALPVAAMTWGLGHVGPASISTLATEVPWHNTASNTDPRAGHQLLHR